MFHSICRCLYVKLVSHVHLCITVSLSTLQQHLGLLCKLVNYSEGALSFDDGNSHN